MPGRRVGDRHRLLRVAVGVLPGQDARSRSCSCRRTGRGRPPGRTGCRSSRAARSSPAVTVTGYCCCARLAIVGVPRPRAAQRRADRAAGERAEEVGERVGARDRHADRRRRDDVRVRRDGRAEDRDGQREGRVGDVRGAPRLDRHLPDARLRVRRGAAERSTGRAAALTGGLVAGRGWRSSRSPTPYGWKRRKRACPVPGVARRAAEVDLERRGAGRDVEEEAAAPGCGRSCRSSSRCSCSRR